MTAIAVRLEKALGSLRERFLRGVPQRLDELSEALRTGAVRDLERGFHSLAGTAGTYGFSTIAALAAEGEMACAAIDDVESLRSLIEQLRAINSPAAEKRPTFESHGEGGRILCVDDDGDQLACIEQILRSAGYEVLTVADAAAFAPALGTFRPDLVLMDVLFPDTTGVDLVRCVRQDDAYATLPIVFLTRQQQAATRMEALEVGGDDYLTKPIAPELLLSVIASRLKRSRSVRALIDRDGLTGVLTRSAFLRRAVSMTEAARRRRSQLAFVMLDLDHFKSINDNFGHPTGDDVLTSFSSFLKRSLRAGDEVGRLGGEEFGLLLPDTNRGQVRMLITRLLEEFSHIPHRTPRVDALYVTFSAGVAMLDDNCDLATWSRRADDALYVAKRGGRARVEAA